MCKLKKLTMKNNLSPILSFRKKSKMNNNPISKNRELDLSSVSTLITETRESVDSSENS